MCECILHKLWRKMCEIIKLDRRLERNLYSQFRARFLKNILYGAIESRDHVTNTRFFFISLLFQCVSI